MEKALLAIGLLVLLGGAVYMMHEKQTTVNLSAIPDEVIQSYLAWQKEYGKKQDDPDQEWYRLTVYNDNYNYIKDFNEDPDNSYYLKQNQFMDLTPEEFAETYLNLLVPKTRGTTLKIENPVANSVDWRDKGVLNAVKNQGSCGSCWAFSTVGAVEPFFALKKGKLPNFSEQQLVDCSKSYGNMGCNGGLMTYGFSYIRDHGVMNQNEYPYTARDGTCKGVDNDNRISGYVEISDCGTLANQIGSQPISVAVDASKWSYYGGGVFSSCSKNLNHGVTLVALGDDGVWTIRNSWGASWGEKGHIRLASGDTCGVCEMASYPTL